MTEVFDHCSEVHVKYDMLSGCIFVIAMNTYEGKRANGGTRMKIYPSLMHGIADALELVKNMSFKCKIIGEEYNGGFSGGKGVIVGDPKSQKTPEMLRRYGEFVNSFAGQFITGTDLNICDPDAQIMAEVSPYIDGLKSGPIGNTAVGTAHGLIFAMREICHLYDGKPYLSGVKVAIQGLGSVGMMLSELLHSEGAQIIAADISPEKCEKAQAAFDAQIVSPKNIYDVKCDIFSPNAEGGVVTEETLKRMTCRFIIGGANNQLQQESPSLPPLLNENRDDEQNHQRNRFKRLDELLRGKNIVYIPDYVVNLGGIYSSICEQRGKDKVYMMQTLREIISKEIRYIASRSKNNATSFLLTEGIRVLEFMDR